MAAGGEDTFITKVYLGEKWQAFAKIVEHHIAELENRDRDQQKREKAKEYRERAKAKLAQEAIEFENCLACPYEPEDDLTIPYDPNDGD